MIGFTMRGKHPGCEMWSGWSFLSNVIVVFDHFKKARIVLPRAAALTSLAISFYRLLDSYATGPPKIMRHPFGLGYTFPFSSLPVDPNGASMPVAL